MKIKRILLLLLILTFLSFLPHTIQTLKPYLEERLPDEFHLDKIALDMNVSFPMTEIPDLSSIASQPFHYIGHGGQAVAFASADNRYVLKFFLKKSMHGKKRYPIPKPTHWIASHRKARQQKREQTALHCLHKAMHNYAVAFEKIKEKTGLIAIHLTPTQDNLPTVTLLDQYGKTHTVELSRASFVFQKKAELVDQKLASLSTEEEKKNAILSLRHFFEERAKEGFIDIERSFMIRHNYGFLGDQPIQLDVGNIEFLEELKASPEQEINRIVKMLHNWAAEEALPYE